MSDARVELQIMILDALSDVWLRCYPGTGLRDLVSSLDLDTLDDHDALGRLQRLQRIPPAANDCHRPRGIFKAVG